MLDSVLGSDWKGYEARLDDDGVSSFWTYKDFHGGFRDKPTRLKEHPTNCGYLQIAFKIRGVYKRVLEHRLVWTIWKGTIPNGYTINHNDEVKNNNRLSNLSLMTRTENLNYGTALKRMGETQRATRKERKPCTLLSPNGEIVSFISHRDAARKIGTSIGGVLYIIKGAGKTSVHGWRFSYVSV